MQRDGLKVLPCSRGPDFARGWTLDRTCLVAAYKDQDQSFDHDHPCYMLQQFSILNYSKVFEECSDKKENEIFLIYQGAVARSYKRKGFLIYEEMQKYLTIYEEAVSHI